ncbi:hypothetical protein [Nocardia sp. NPDC004711]
MTSHAGPEAYVVRLRAGNPFRPTAYMAIAPEIDTTDPAATIYGVHLGTHDPDTRAAVPEALVPHPTVTPWKTTHVHTAAGGARLDHNMFGELVFASIGTGHPSPLHGPVALTMADGGQLPKAVISALVGAMDAARSAEDKRCIAAAVADPATVSAARSWLIRHAEAGEFIGLTPRDMTTMSAARVIEVLDVRYSGGLYGFQRDHAADITAARTR